MFRRLLQLGFAMAAMGSPALGAGNSAVSIAAAANFTYALNALHAEFKRAAPDVTVTLTHGASGSLFAQIANGAPFDVFLSADTEYPERAAAARIGDPETLCVFARGRLVAWTMRRDLALDDLAAAVKSPSVRKIAIAHPKTAPYGRAAQRALEELGAWKTAQPKIVTGESITQTAQFVETGSADLGFVALALVRSPRLAGKGVWREVPAGLQGNVSLDHAAILTTRGTKNPAAKRFLEFLASEPAKKILRDFGYSVP